MAQVVITMKVMPESPEIDLTSVEKEAEKAITGFGAELGKKEIEPVAFGLKALKLFLVMDEEKGSTDDLEAQIKELPGVTSVEVVDVRRAVG